MRREFSRKRSRIRASDEYYCSRCGQELPEYRDQGKLIGHEWHEWVETPGGLLKFVDTKGDNDANAKKV